MLGSNNISSSNNSSEIEIGRRSERGKGSASVNAIEMWNDSGSANENEIERQRGCGRGNDNNKQRQDSTRNMPNSPPSLEQR